MSRRALPPVLATVLAACLLGCGGGDDDAGEPNEPAPREAIARADANCREFEREVRKLGRGVLSNPDLLEATTELVVAPSIPLLKGMATRQQALIPSFDNPDYELYAELYDPAIVLSQARLQAGRANDPEEARRLEEQLLVIAVEQIEAARAAGLADCDEDFQVIVQESFTP